MSETIVVGTKRITASIALVAQTTMTDNNTVLDLDAEIESYQTDGNDECMEKLSLF